MDSALYAAIFDLAAEWEVSSDQCSFQYIVTTTTAPPDHLQSDEFVKLKMTGLKIDGFEEENTIIESDSISIELKSLERIGTKEIDGITMYPVRGIPCGINKKTLHHNE